jgi:hypothetical protein
MGCNLPKDVPITREVVARIEAMVLAGQADETIGCRLSIRVGPVHAVRWRMTCSRCHCLAPDTLADPVDEARLCPVCGELRFRKRRLEKDLDLRQTAAQRRPRRNLSP